MAKKKRKSNMRILRFEVQLTAEEADRFDELCDAAADVSSTLYGREVTPDEVVMALITQSIDEHRKQLQAAAARAGLL